MLKPDPVIMAAGMERAGNNGSAAEDSGGDHESLLVTVVSFNFGIDQEMFAAKPWMETHSTKFKQLLTTLTTDYSADIVLGCEIGAYQKGMTDYLARDVCLPNLMTTFRSNYMTSLSQKGNTPSTIGTPEIMELDEPDFPLQVQLVLTAVQPKEGSKKGSIMAIGNMRIGPPTSNEEQYGPTIATRQRLVMGALAHVENYGNRVVQEMHPDDRRGVALLLVGDCNLSKEMAAQTVAALQPRGVKTACNVWKVRATSHGLQGDVAFYKGCLASSFDVGIGSSWPDSGMRNDVHDALGLMLSVPILGAPMSAEELPSRSTTSEDKELGNATFLEFSEV